MMSCDESVPVCANRAKVARKITDEIWEDGNKSNVAASTRSL